LLPPENASGNFVKVVQRLPVLIRFDRDQDPQHTVRPGKSVEPTVKVRRKGDRVGLTRSEPDQSGELSRWFRNLACNSRTAVFDGEKLAGNYLDIKATCPR